MKIKRENNFRIRKNGNVDVTVSSPADTASQPAFAADDDIQADTGANHEPVLGARQAQIRQLVQARGFVTIEHLAHEFAVTPQTIRRDIRELSKIGLIQRYHGGAGITSSIENLAYSKRKILCFHEKQKIAQTVAREIPEKSSLFMNIGTTTEAVARELCNHKRLRVVTNNLNVATILSANENFEVIIAGGLVRHRDYGIIGEATVDFIQQFRVDFGIIGISGIDIDGALLDFDYREVRAARAIIDNSRKVFLVTDHTKFGRNAMVGLGSISEIDALFTDQSPPQALVEIMKKADVQLFVA